MIYADTIWTSRVDETQRRVGVAIFRYFSHCLGVENFGCFSRIVEGNWMSLSSNFDADLISRSVNACLCRFSAIFFAVEFKIPY